MTLIQTAVTAAKEIKLLRAALASKNGADELSGEVNPTSPAELRLRAFDQQRAAEGIAREYEDAGHPAQAAAWRAVAECFADAGERLLSQRS